ncbi:IS4 family transposase [Endozoicomonas lisbonensis]|uniref:Transposase IS4-like domain-containing protein n=1 Tax=Endozoicomonas lisbonensis TaxID=3120522 RepID=A0ABV2SII9_9GAMM
MNPVTALQNKLSVHLDWNKARCEFIAQFILGLIKLRTSSLYRLRVAFVREASPDSSYKRIQRFFRSYSLDYSAIARLIVTLVPLEPKWTLCLDRTNWKLGSQDINHLVLAVCCQGVAIPLFWSNLDKAGCSESNQRIALMKRFLATFPDQPVACLSADREFHGHGWLSWLMEQGILFRVRIKKNTQVAKPGSSAISVRLQFRSLKAGTWDAISKPCKIWGLKLYVAGSLSHKGYCFVVSQDKPDTIIPDYHCRWEIESLFSCLKTRGFDMEACRLTAPERTDKLTALLALAFCWSYTEWLKRQAISPSRIAKTRFGASWPAESIFHQGLEYLQELLLNPDKLKRGFKQALNFFVP